MGTVSIETLGRMLSDIVINYIRTPSSSIVFIVAVIKLK